MKETLKRQQPILVVIAFALCAVVALGIDYRQRVRSPQLAAERASVARSAGARVKVERGAIAIPEPGPQTGGSFDLSRNVIAGGGSSLGSGNPALDETVGQSAAGTAMSGGSFTQTGGFWQPESESTPTPTPTPT